MTAPAAFIFATEDGTIAAWNPRSTATTAVLKVDNSGSGAVYKGLALASSGRAELPLRHQLPRRHGRRVRQQFRTYTSRLGQFTDPDLPQGFAPFGIQNTHRRDVCS